MSVTGAVQAVGPLKVIDHEAVENPSASYSTPMTVAAAAAATVIGVEYEALGFSTASWSMTFNGPTACTAPVTDIDYSVNLPQPVWDQISSFQALFGTTICDADHYFLQNFGLPRTGFFGTSSPVPTMNVGGG